jgi:hypothetical protein
MAPSKKYKSSSKSQKEKHEKFTIKKQSKIDLKKFEEGIDNMKTKLSSLETFVLFNDFPENAEKRKEIEDLKLKINSLEKNIESYRKQYKERLIQKASSVTISNEDLIKSYKKAIDELQIRLKNKEEDIISNNSEEDIEELENIKSEIQLAEQIIKNLESEQSGAGKTNENGL